MESLLTDVNWSAILVGTVASFLMGWLWYSQMLFGAIWRQGLGQGDMADANMGVAMVSQLGSTFLLAWVVGIMYAMGSWQLMALVALLLSGIIESNGLFSQKKYPAIIVEAGFVLVMVALMWGVQMVV